MSSAATDQPHKRGHEEDGGAPAELLRSLLSEPQSQLPGAENDGSAPRRWGLCFAAIVALHIGGVWVVLHLHPPGQPALPPPPAPIAVIMAPAPSHAAPRAPQPETRPAPKQKSLPSHPQPKPPRPVVRRRIPPPEIAGNMKAASAIRAQPKAAPPERIVHEAPKSSPENVQPAPVVPAQPHMEAPPVHAVAAATPAAPAPPNNAAPTWQGLLLGRLERFKRYPESAQQQRQQGVVYLRFTMDRQGKVLSAAIDKSSGFDALDAETLALIHRAEPLPAPPPEVPGDPVQLVVPIQFFLTPA